MKDLDVELPLLFDYYGGLLTPKQQACFDLYYNQDYSLAEIGEEFQISRQAVFDTLSRAEKTLRAMEGSTGGCCAGSGLPPGDSPDPRRRAEADGPRSGSGGSGQGDYGGRRHHQGVTKWHLKA